MKKIFIVMMLFFFIPVSSHAAPSSNKLVIYCGVTMLKPMVEISKQFEEKYECKIQFVKGGSGKLLTLLLKNKNGDLFLPGSESYIAKLENEHKGLIQAKELVGYNKASFIVKKGNPKNFKPDLDNLQDETYRVILGSPDKGSIGKETKKILSGHGSFEQVAQKAVMTKHSQSLINAIKNDKADVAINWYAVSLWPENANIVDAIQINELYAKKKKLILTVLKDSKNPDLATAFLNLAVSPYGKSIFLKYGLAE